MLIRYFSSTASLHRLNLSLKNKVKISANMSPYITELINGLILSDAHLRMIGYAGKDARMQIQQKDKEFMQYLYYMLKPLGLVGSPGLRTKGPQSSPA
jgi:exopolysaccharide biosynthesis protein